MKRIIYIWIALLFTACYDDLGNYDYTDINELNIMLPEEYAVYLEKDTVLTLEPQLSQALVKNEDNLTFMWLHSTTNTNFYTIKDCDTLGYTKSVQYRFDPDEKGIKYVHYFRLNIYDKVTGINYPVNTQVTLVKPFTGAWMVLHEKNGQTELGAVQYVGKKIKVSEDAYYDETGKRFQGAPVCLGRLTSGYKPYGGSGSTEWMMFAVVTDEPEESGIYCQWNHFEKMDSMGAEGNMLRASTIGKLDPTKLDLIDGECNKGGIVLSEGQFYQMPKAMKIHKPTIDFAQNEADVFISHAAKAAHIALVYDEKGHRFAFFDCEAAANNASYVPTTVNANENATKLKLIPPIQNLNTTEADPDKVDPKQKMLYIGNGFNYDLSNWVYSYAYALSMQDNYCYVYKFDVHGIKSPGAGHASFPAYYRFDRPADLGEECCFTSSAFYSDIIFYASGNSVYRLDFSQTTVRPTLIYTHDGGKAVKMKFARPGFGAKTLKNVLWYDKYQFDVNYSLGIVFDMGNGKSDFVVLNLAATGSIGADSEDYEAKQVYEDFGEIKDFVFI